MSHLSEFSRIDTEFLKQNRIGLLGGTFNPVHNGHLKMAYIALYEFGLGEIIFLPLGDPPHKRNEYLACAASRLEMIRLAIADEKRFSLSTSETDRKGLTYTVDTLEIFTREHPQSSFYYIIGADTLFELENWKNFKRVIFLTDFICILRPGHDQRRVLECADRLNNRYGYKIYVADERGPDISSSQIRSQISENKLSDGLVPKKVAKYITNHKIYNQED